MGTMVMKRGDLWPDLTATLTGVDSEGATVPVDLTTAESVTVVGVRNGSVIFERVASGDANGVVTMGWEAGDTDEIGYIRLEFVVEWPNGKEQTFPTEGVERVRVTLDQGGAPS